MRRLLLTLRSFREVMQPVPPDPAKQLFRLKAVERDVVLPIKALYIGYFIYYFYLTPWYGEYGESGTAREIAQSLIDRFFILYIVINVALAAFLLVKRRRLPLTLAQRVVFIVSFIDGIFMASLTLVTGGFDSTVYWLFAGLIVRNALVHPVARSQVTLNLSTLFAFMVAGVCDILILRYDATLFDEPFDSPTEPLLLRCMVLLLLTVVCYGLQVLFDKAQRASEEGREFAARQDQLRAAGRVAAEIAHQMKNPLGIINNAAFALQRAITSGKPVSNEQVEIIREEVTRADRIITELMGYAQLAEGTVERLNVVHELNRAIATVFPAGAYRGIQVRTDYQEDLPPLLMQKKHLSEMVVNVLQNAREAVANDGAIEVCATNHDDTVEIVIKDDGPGIPPEKIEKVFEPYFTTKEQGTGLGLAIVRHNAEIYDGRVRVESELGQGSRFILELPTRTLMRKRK